MHQFEEQQYYDKFEVDVPDQYWGEIDRAGHVHYYDDRLAYLTGTNYPTLMIRTETHWEDCDDEWTDSFYVCSKCGERIRPGTKREIQAIAGIRTCLIDGIPVSEEELDRAVAEFFAPAE